jgi:hypothetical protein
MYVTRQPGGYSGAGRGARGLVVPANAGSAVGHAAGLRRWRPSRLAMSRGTVGMVQAPPAASAPRP